jgi:molybdate transport system substrate-binding protein
MLETNKVHGLNGSNGWEKLLRMIKRQKALLLGLLIFSPGCSRQPSGALTVFGAASLIAPMQEIAAQFDSLHGGKATRLNFAASSVLARQIEEQAPADVFISASPEWTTYLARQRFVDSTAVVVIARNLLVVIADLRIEPPPATLQDLLQEMFWPVAIGDPSHVPLGKYAQAALTHAGLWNEISPHLVPALDADAAVAIVERGAAPAGIAYRNEAVDNPRVRLAFEFPDSLQPDIQYTAGVVTNTPNRASG